jgi:hypothetical protein
MYIIVKCFTGDNKHWPSLDKEIYSDSFDEAAYRILTYEEKIQKANPTWKFQLEFHD